MSLTSLNKAVRDPDLQARVDSAAQTEARTNADLSGTKVAADITAAMFGVGVNLFIWPVAIDYEDQYESAIGIGVQNPGGDPTIITDDQIRTSIITHWPPDPS